MAKPSESRVLKISVIAMLCMGIVGLTSLSDYLTSQQLATRTQPDIVQISSIANQP